MTKEIIVSKKEAAADEIAAPYNKFVRRRKIKWPELSATGRPKATMMNALMAIQELGLECRYDVFHGRCIINGTELGGFIGDVSDKVTRKIRRLSAMHFGLDPGKDSTYDGVLGACEEHQFDPLVDYLDSLKWDGKPRLDTWLTRYAGVEDTPLHRAWGRMTLLAATGRVREHGCKYDHVLVLEGPEGRDKSSLVQVLASGHAGGRDNFSDSGILHKNEKEQMELTQGVWFYEIAELAGMKKADQHAVKAFITRQEERARPAYGRFKELQPRICIFIGTFNTTGDGELIEYLNPGDNRRWFPVRVGKINIKALERDRDQLFAEADIEVNLLGESLKLDPSLYAAATEVQKSREVVDTLADTLSTLYNETIGGRSGAGCLVSDDEVWVSSKHVIDLLHAMGHRCDSRRIKAAMRANGWRAVNDRRSGSMGRGYVHHVPKGPLKHETPETHESIES